MGRCIAVSYGEKVAICPETRAACIENKGEVTLKKLRVCTNVEG